MSKQNRRTTEEEKAAGWVSVTRVTDYFTEPELVEWKVKTGLKEANRISRLAAKTGTRVHDLIYKDWEDGSYKLIKADSLEVRNCMSAWEDFKRNHRINISHMEFELRDEASLVRGYADMEAEGIILDIKTSGFIKPRHWIQLATYAKIHKSKTIAILRLDRNLGIYEFIEKEADSLPTIFSPLLEIYRFYTSANGIEENKNDHRNSTPDSPTDKEISSR